MQKSRTVFGTTITVADADQLQLASPSLESCRRASFIRVGCRCMLAESQLEVKDLRFASLDLRARGVLLQASDHESWALNPVATFIR